MDLDDENFGFYGPVMNGLKHLRTLKGLSQARLAELAGTSQPQIKRLEDGNRKLTKEWAERLAPHLGVDAQALLFPDQNGQAKVSSNISSLSPVVRVPVAGKLRRYRSAYAGQGGAVIMDDVFDEIEPPKELDGVTDAYACYVHGDSMEPFLFAGDTVFCHPYKPPRRDDFVVLQIVEDHPEGPIIGLVKQYVAQDYENVTVRQFMPAREITVPRSRVKSIHKVVSITKP